MKHDSGHISTANKHILKVFPDESEACDVIGINDIVRDVILAVIIRCAVITHHH